jgi:hypothetical protein
MTSRYRFADRFSLKGENRPNRWFGNRPSNHSEPLEPLTPKARERAHKIVILAKARMGEITKAMPKAPDGKRRGSESKSMTQKNITLAAEGISKQQANEAEKLADLKASGDLDRVLASLDWGKS